MQQKLEEAPHPAMHLTMTSVNDADKVEVEAWALVAWAMIHHPHRLEAELPVVLLGKALSRSRPD